MAWSDGPSYNRQMHGKELLRDLGLPKKHGLTARELLRILGAAQGGQFAVRQATALGASRAEVRVLLDRREAVHLRRGVLGFEAAGADLDAAITAFLACWPVGVISHASAALHHRLTRVAVPTTHHVTVPHGRTCRPSGVEVHHTRMLVPTDTLRLGPLRYTSLARTVCDLADGSNMWETLSILDDAVALGAKPKWINAVALPLTVGRSGVSLIERATRPGSSNEFRSWLERAGAHVFAAGGLPAPQWNVPIRHEGKLLGVVDALWLPHRVVCELKGLRFHTTPQQIRRDDQRSNQLLDAGYAVRAVSWRDLVDDPAGVVATVKRALASAGAAIDPQVNLQHIHVPVRPYL